MTSNLPCSASDGAGVLPVFDKTIQTTSGETRFQRFPSDTAPAAFGELAPVAEIWQNRRRAGQLPGWRDFDFRDFVGWHRNIALSDLGRGRADPCFRIFGTGVAEVLGADLTGSSMSGAFPTAEADGVLDHFAALRDEVLIGLLSGRVVTPGREHVAYMVIELPLAGEGGSVAQLLHCFAR